jgi:hypothetical protein
LENPTVVYASYVRSTNSEDDRQPARKPSFNADWTANSRVVDSDYEGGNPLLSKQRIVDMDDYKMHNVSGLQDVTTLTKRKAESSDTSGERFNTGRRRTSSSSSSSSDAGNNVDTFTDQSNPLNSTGITSTNNVSGSPVAIRRQSPPQVRREYN